jgi:thioredoxin reductase
MRTVGVAVVGYNVVGCLCAIEVRAHGHSVALLDYTEENGALESMIAVPPSLLNHAPVAGETFAELVRSRVALDGIIAAGSASRIVRVGDGFVIEMFIGEDVSARKVVFATVGVERAAPEFYEHLGVGVSTEAWSDAPLLRGASVAVVGGGRRAAEQALVALRSGVGTVVVLCERTSADFGELAQQMKDSGIHVRTGTKVTGLVPGPNRRLRCIHIRAGGIDTTLDVEYVFLARGLQCDWSALGGGPIAGVYLAGAAAGISSDDRPGLVADAHRAALEVVTSSVAE